MLRPDHAVYTALQRNSQEDLIILSRYLYEC